MKRHAGSGVPHGSLNKGTHTRPSPTHGGTNLAKGVVHGAPTRPAVNAANYAGQVKRK